MLWIKQNKKSKTMNNDFTAPRLRDSARRLSHEPYGLNEIPNETIIKLGGYIVYLLYSGRKDITGDEFGDAFAYALDGIHLASPLGIADVALDRIAWSAKTVKQKNPFSVKTARLISGRCSPDYSYGITDPHKDIQKTGTAVLNIWNERVNIAQDNYSAVRTAILIRSYDLLSYVLFEEENHRYRTSDYIWKANKNGNLIGISKETGEQCFTWQPHGSQFTIHTSIPESAKRFKLRKPPIIDAKGVLENLKFDSSWISFF